MKHFAFVVCAAILEIVSQLLIKEYSVTHQVAYMVGAVSLYGIICFLLSYLYKQQSIGVTQALWSGFSIIASLILGIYFFKDSISKMDVVGVFFITVGIFLLYEHA